MDTEHEQPFAVSIDGSGIVRLRWTPRTRITGELAARAMTAVDVLRGDERGPVLVTMAGIDIPTWDARQVFAGPGTATRVALVGTAPTDRMIARFSLGTEPRPVPQEFFYREDDAVRWLLRTATEDRPRVGTIPGRADER